MFREYHRYKILLMASDVFLTVLLLAGLVQFGPMVFGVALGPVAARHDWWIYLLVGLFWHVLFAATGVYELSRIPRFSEQIRPLTSSYILAVLVFMGLLYLTSRELSRTAVMCFAVADYFMLLSVRYAIALHIGRERERGRKSTVLIVGISDSAAYLAQTISQDREGVFEVVGFVDKEPRAHLRLPAPRLGSPEDLPRLINELRIDTVIIALPVERSGELEPLILRLERLPVRAYVVPDLLALTLLNSDVERLGELVVIGIKEPLIQGHRWVTKRVLDLLISTLVLLTTWPLWIVIWIAVRLDSPGPGLFVADRVGQNGKIFKMFKFRTMKAGLEKVQQEAAGSPEVSRGDSCKEIYKVKDDPRITRVGKFLRKTSLDELPQLINVFKGEMSLVGPRPEQPFLTECYDHWQWQRFAVPPGVTGWWQISGRGELPMHLNAQYDVYYVRNYSLWLDLKILFKTVGVVLKGRGAY